MDKQKIQRRKKPVVAYANARGASENISSKCDLITELVAQSTSTLVNVETRAQIINNLPKSIRQFNLWTSASLPLEIKSHSFKRNANQTLNLNPDLLERVKQCIDAVKSAAHRPTAESKKNATAAALRRQLNLNSELKAIAENELIALKRRNNQLEDDLIGLRRALAAEKRESQEAISSLQSIIEKLTKKEAQGTQNVINIQKGKTKKKLVKE